ncbi:uncharacterized protein GGS22DRAFT_63580 [Annulohypoxylon maeteangense]|uniref:uncharacterized protein n=1 Tax=Annulohypoxylon maeteangense TaxID=1927788 RepID=UPI0020084A56|nr:uncharacterized protein GGS22DRAFT_63580 [Annulohypoxylon maeteangense]KAI0888834.1 hypothetical protein GGS22DRAFT_63580 [Annulohypoxylon maeteangense]
MRIGSQLSPSRSLAFGRVCLCCCFIFPLLLLSLTHITSMDSMGCCSRYVGRRELLEAIARIAAQFLRHLLPVTIAVALLAQSRGSNGHLG